METPSLLFVVDKSNLKKYAIQRTLMDQLREGFLAKMVEKGKTRYKNFDEIETEANKKLIE